MLTENATKINKSTPKQSWISEIRDEAKQSTFFSIWYYDIAKGVEEVRARLGPCGGSFICLDQVYSRPPTNGVGSPHGS